MLKFLRIAGLALVFLYLPWVVQAQVSQLAMLSAPNTEAFPTVTAFLEVRNEGGDFVAGLEAGEVTVWENGQALPARDLTELRPGVQFVIAINPGVTFSPRDSQGQSRYDHLVAALAGWAEGVQATTPDQFSLVMNGAQGVARVSDPAALLEALSAAPTDHRNATPNLQVLFQAITLAAETPPQPGMGQAVLFITPNPTRDELPALESLGTQAAQSGVRLFVWMVAPESQFLTEGAQTLQELARSTGGQYFAYSGSETIPDIHAYLEPLRSVYLLSYTSQIQSAGEHTLAVEVHTPEFQTTSNQRSFPLNVLPPNPILVSPPSTLHLTPLTDPRTNQLTGHTPAQQTLEIIIEFPDGYPRELVRTTLYINGQIVDERTEAPFDRLTWDLTRIAESGEFVIQVEAVDTLGLSAITLPNTVDVTVQQLPQGFAAEISRQSSAISAVVVLISGAVLILALVMVIRRKHDPHDTGRWKRRKQKRRREPVTRPSAATLAAQKASRRRKVTGWVSEHLPNRLPWAASSPRGRKPEPYAYLERVYEPDSLEALTPTQPIPILNNVITFGADPTKATLVLEEPSIAPQHARMRRDRDGNFYLYDHGSVAGTWINYCQTNGKEFRIQHGDLIHLGRVGFRFCLPNPPETYQPVIVFEETGQNGNAKPSAARK